jgi:hypothetical protein
MNDLSLTLENYGADIEGGLRLFVEVKPELLPYATLLADRNQVNSDLKALWGVYEWQSTPLVFLVNGDEIQGDEHFRRIRRRVALRGDAPYLGVVRPGQLTIHRVSLDKDGHGASLLKDLPSEDKRIIFPYLANTRPNIASHSKWISSIVLKLLRDAIRDLRKQNVADDDAISLTGRALFLRFLGDRNLLPQKLGPPEQIFNDANRAESASRWLDKTFNGDFLPLSDGLFSRLPCAALNPLGNILHRAKGGQLYLGWQEKWNYLDFAHIPVGVLSETYEHYMREHDRERQRKEGSFYTPRAIADLMVNASFHALRREGKSADARVLDPAAGAGVFLVSAFRQLVMERWVKDDKRPDTKTLREILYNQIVGFDINEAALRFAALGLYLMSIELDPEPEPVEKLRFNENLNGVVLHNLHKGGAGELGSLGKTTSAKHVGQYDLVIGNPPWPGDTKLKRWPEVKEIVDEIARERLLENAPPPIPNEVLDLPFVWRAMEWGKPGGQIAFALHARLLFQQGNGMVEARAALFRALNVSGVINGAELRNSRVWPEISAPFCLLFARNQLPPIDAAFRFVTPHLEDGLNGAGTMRIDAANAELLTPAQIVEYPAILKTLVRGSALDLEIFDRVKARKLVPLEQYWRKRFGEKKGRLKYVTTGYQRVCKSTINPQSSDHLRGKPDLPSDADLPLLIDVRDLDSFSLPSLHRARDPEAYEGPLLIVHKSPPTTGERIRVSMSEQDLVFNEVYYGYSGKEHPSAIRFIRYLTLLLGSKPAFWYVLMTSGEFGFEREVVEKIIIDNIPIIPFESLDSSALEQIDPLFEALALNDSSEYWAKVDAWAASLYGLDEQDLQVIDDTLRYNLPFASNKKAAQTPPSKDEVAAFCHGLKSELLPWAQREGVVVEVQPKSLPIASPWRVFRACATATNSEYALPTEDWPEVLRVADRLASTEVILSEPDTRSLWVARLNQARYWSRSQARLVARRIVWEHLDSLFGGEFE